MIPESGIIRRGQSKNVHRPRPLLSFSPPYRAIFLFALYPTWEPVQAKKTVFQQLPLNNIMASDSGDRRLMFFIGLGIVVTCVLALTALVLAVTLLSMVMSGPKASKPDATVQGKGPN